MTVIIDPELYRMTTDAILVLLQLLPLLFFVFFLKHRRSVQIKIHGGIAAVALTEPGAFELSVRLAAISAGQETDTRNGHHYFPNRLFCYTLVPLLLARTMWSPKVDWMTVVCTE